MHSRQYGDRVTPFDHFMSDFKSWLDGAWYVWVALVGTVAALVAVVAVSKSRARARARVPQYRRQGGFG